MPLPFADAAATGGSLTENRMSVPGPSLSATATWPPMRLTSPRTMKRPRPEPDCVRVEEESTW